jgi:hypothetical protein
MVLNDNYNTRNNNKEKNFFFKISLDILKSTSFRIKGIPMEKNVIVDKCDKLYNMKSYNHFSFKIDIFRNVNI